MTEKYPIVSKKYLEPVRTRGFLGIKRTPHRSDELPRPHAHQVLVYRVDGQYLVDNGRLAGDDDHVIRATHVSCVDVGADVPVTTRLTISSAEASDFTVRTTFTCTVTDPVRVVRENVDAETALLTYLRRHQPLAHLGLAYRMSDINRVRREVSAQVKAYTEVKPPDVPGLRVSLAGVEVLTPQELAEFEKARREKHLAHLLASEAEDFSHEREIHRVRQTQELADEQRQYRHRTDLDDRAHERLVGLQEQRHRQRMRHEENEFARREVDAAVEAIGGDPHRALLWAHAHGELDARGLADRITADQDRRAELSRSDEARQIEWDREYRLRAAQQDREDRIRAEQQDREDRRREFDLRSTLLQELLRRGHADLIHLPTERLIAELYGLTPEAVGAEPKASVGALPQPEAPAIDAVAADGEGNGSRRRRPEYRPDRRHDGEDLPELEVREEDV